MTCASVSRTWRRLCEDGQTWRQRCLEKGYVKFDAPSLRCLGANEEAICSHLDLQDADQNRREREIEYGQCYERPSWKSLYLRKMRIISNWRFRAIQSSIVEHASTFGRIFNLQVHSGRIVTLSRDSALRVWNVDDAQPALTLTGHTDYISTFQLSDDGKYIVSGSSDRTVRVWCAQAGVQRHVLRGHTDAILCLSLHGTTLVSGSEDQTLRVLDIVDGKCLHILTGHRGRVLCVKFDGERAVSGSDDSTVKVWNVHTGECLHTLRSRTDKIRSLLFEPERDLVVSEDGDGRIYVWDVRKGTYIVQIVDRQEECLLGAQLRGNILIFSNSYSDVEVWDIRDGGSCIHRLQVTNNEEGEITLMHRHTSRITSLQLLDSGLLVTASRDGVKLWDVDKGIFVRDLLRLQPNRNFMAGFKATETLIVCTVRLGNGTRGQLTLMDFDAAYP